MTGTGVTGTGTAISRDVFIVANNISELGGLQRFAHTLAGLLASAGHRVLLIGIVHPADRHDYPLDGSYRTEVIHERHPPSPVYGPAWKRLRPGAALRNARRARTIRAGAARLSELFAQAEPGGVVIVPQVWAMEWVAAADTNGLRVIGMSHESFAASKASSRRTRVHRFFAGVDRLLLLTQADADAWAGDGLTNVGVMPNPLTLRADAASTLGEKVVVSLGRLSFEKGPDLLLESWAAVAERYPDWTLQVFGGGPEEDAVRRQIGELGLEGKVELRGQTQDVAAALLGGSVLALTSRQEGLPTVLVEAMAAGVPCVSFDCAPGVREIITDGEDGLVVTPGNTVEMADALCRLIDDEELRRTMGARARQSVRRYAPEVILERWQREFANVYR